MSKGEKPVIPCPECGARHGDQCTYSLCPRRSLSNARRTARSPGARYIPPAALWGAYFIEFDGSTEGRALICRSSEGAETDRIGVLGAEKSWRRVHDQRACSPSRCRILPVEAYDRGSRLELISTQDRCGVCRRARFSTGNPLYLNRGLLVSLYPPGEFPEGSRSFPFIPRALQRFVGDLSERFEQVSVTPSVRFSTSSEGEFFCRNLSAENRKGPVKC